MTDDAQAFLPRGKPALSQDPHKVRDISERNLEAAIGREVRAFRRQQGLTVADLAQVTGLSSFLQFCVCEPEKMIAQK